MNLLPSGKNIKSFLNEAKMLQGRDFYMTQSKSQKERQWAVRKQSQNSHGKVKSFDQLAEEAGKK